MAGMCSIHISSNLNKICSTQLYIGLFASPASHLMQGGCSRSWQLHTYLMQGECSHASDLMQGE